MPEPKTRTVQLDGPFDLRATVAPVGKGSTDAARPLADGGLWRAWRTEDGPVTLRMEQIAAGVQGTAWGPGAERALDQLPMLVGADDDLGGFRPEHPVLRELLRRRPGRFGRTNQALEVLLRAIPEQRVTGKAAGRTGRDLRRRFGEPAPGPAGLRLPPDPNKLATLSYASLHSAGLERSRATTLLEVCRRARRIEALADRPPEDAVQALQSIRGIGPWTANRVAATAWGWTDAVETGDYWLPSSVSWVLAKEPRANDERMLELLEPYRPHRARVIRLIMGSGLKAPRFGPRMTARDFRSE